MDYVLTQGVWKYVFGALIYRWPEDVVVIFLLIVWEIREKDCWPFFLGLGFAGLWQTKNAIAFILICFLFLKDAILLPEDIIL